MITEKDICNQLWGRQGDPFNCPTLIGDYQIGTEEKPVKGEVWFASRDEEKFFEGRNREQAEKAVRDNIIDRVNDVLKD